MDGSRAVRDKTKGSERSAHRRPRRAPVRESPTADVVFDLQRSVGNSTTSLLVQRANGRGRIKRRVYWSRVGRRRINRAETKIAELDQILHDLTAFEPAHGGIAAARSHVGEIRNQLAIHDLALHAAARSGGRGVASSAKATAQAVLDIEHDLQPLFVLVRDETTDLARQAHQAVQIEEREQLLAIHSRAKAHAAEELAPLDAGEAAPRTGPESRPDQTHRVLDPVAVGNDAFGGVAGGVSIGDLSTGGLTVAGGPVTLAAQAIGGIAGGLSVIFGAIGVILGVNAAARGSSAEKRLQKLIDDDVISDLEVEEFAKFAKEKKRKKKLGGGIGITLGAGAIVAGVLGLVAIGIATFGVGAAVLGIGMALLGLGVVLGKSIHRSRKRKAFTNKISDISDNLLLAGLVPDGESVRHQIEAMGVDVDWTSYATARVAEGALTAALSTRISSRRDMAALSLVGYLTGPVSSAMFDAEMVVEALGLDADELRKIALTQGVPTAQARVAAKMRSW